MSLICSKCDHDVGQVTHYNIDDDFVVHLCTRCEIKWEDGEWDLPDELEDVRKAGLRLFPKKAT